MDPEVGVFPISCHGLYCTLFQRVRQTWRELECICFATCSWSQQKTVRVISASSRDIRARIYLLISKIQILGYRRSSTQISTSRGILPCMGCLNIHVGKTSDGMPGRTNCSYGDFLVPEDDISPSGSIGILRIKSTWQRPKMVWSNTVSTFVVWSLYYSYIWSWPMRLFFFSVT